MSVAAGDPRPDEPWGGRRRASAEGRRRVRAVRVTRPGAGARVDSSTHESRAQTVIIALRDGLFRRNVREPRPEDACC